MDMTLTGWENDHLIGIVRVKGENQMLFVVESILGPCGPFEIVNEIKIPEEAIGYHSPHIFRYKSAPSWMYEYWVTFIAYIPNSSSVRFFWIRLLLIF
jgi:hypothetical protein